MPAASRDSIQFHMVSYCSAIKGSLFYLMHPPNNNSHKKISVLFVEFLTRLLHIVLQAKQSKPLLTEEICPLSQVMMNIFPHRNR